MEKYYVNIESLNDLKAKASREKIEYEFSAKMNDNTTSFNAAEVLLSAFGDCLLTNIHNISKRMHLNIEKIRIEIEGARLDDPPRISEISYTIYFKTEEKLDKLDQLVALSLKYGTVTNTLKNVKIIGKIKMEE